MGKFTYVGSGVRVYPNLSVSGSVLVAESGKTYDLDADPGDGLWTSISAPVADSVTPSVGNATSNDADGDGAVSPESAPESPVTPSNDVPDVSTSSTESEA